MRYFRPSSPLPLALTPPSPVTRISSDQLATPVLPKRTDSPGIAPSGRDLVEPGGERRKDLRVGSVSDFIGSTFGNLVPDLVPLRVGCPWTGIFSCGRKCCLLRHLVHSHGQRWTPLDSPWKNSGRRCRRFKSCHPDQ